MARKLHIKTYGCQMNEYDSSRMADLLRPMGYELSAAEDGADLVILNTCHIREKAAEKVFSELGRLRRRKEEKESSGGRMLIAVAGCVAQAQGAELARRAPVVDIVVGPQSYHRLPALIARIEQGAGRVLETDFPADGKFDFLPGERAAEGASAFLTVQEGCDKFCTFCVVPYTRGAEFSRGAAQIEAEARRLVASGAREIVLLGQNVNAYHGRDEEGREIGLARLIRRLSAIAGLARIRYTTSHPRDMDEELIAAHGEIASLMPSLHLPVQSGSDRVLARMNRGHTARDYLRLVEKLRAARPDIALSSDFIVGFPGETEADFRATLALVREVAFAQAFSFKYSPRPGTPAAAEPQLDDEVKSARLYELQALLAAQQRAFNESCLGRTMDVLFERPGRHEGQLTGRTPYLQAVHADAPASLINAVARVKITALETNSLGASLLEQESVCA